MTEPLLSVAPRAISRVRWNHFQDRRLASLVTKLLAPRRQCFKTTIKKAFAERDFAGGRRIYQEFFSEFQTRLLLRWATSGEYPLSKILRLACKHLDDAHLKSFVRTLGIALDRGIKKPLYDDVDRVILLLWDGFDVLPELPGNFVAAQIRRYPPLPRWAGPAARECVAHFVWWFAQVKDLPSSDKLAIALMERRLVRPLDCYIPDYETYRKRLERLGLKTEKPILVTKAKFDRSAGTLRVTLAHG